MPWIVDWKVAIDGRDLTAKWRPVLMSISVSDKAGAVSDSCNLDVDDAGGQLRLPRGGESLTVWLEGAKVFEGVIDQPKSSGSRGSGRKLSINAKGFDTAGRAKEAQAFHLDDGTLEGFLGKAAANAGFSLSIDPELGAIVRDYWSAEHESFLALGQRLAHQHEATFKLRGTKAVFARRGEGLAPNGAALPLVRGVYGDNLISWDIVPRDPRRAFSGGQAHWFDRQAAAFKTQNLTFTADGGDAENIVRAPVADSAEAGHTLDGRKRQTRRQAGTGSVTLDIAVEARAEGTFELSGARPGVDGTYRIDSVAHKADRGGGSTTSLSLRQPAGGAGTDSRTA